MNGTSHRTPGPPRPGVHFRTAAAGFLGIVVGLAGGIFLVGEPAVPASSGSLLPAGGSRLEVRRAAGAERLPATSLRSRERQPTVRGPDDVGPLRLGIDPAVLVDLVRTDQPPLEERVILFSGNDRVAEALEMSADEKASLEREWAKIKDMVLRRQRDALRHEQRDDQLWLGAGPFDGEAMQSTFREAVLAILGSERGEAFLGMVRADEAFGGWGRRTSAAYSIRYDRQSDGSLVYRMTERSSPDGPAGKSWISNQIPTHIREMTDVLGILPEAPDPP